MDLPRTKTHCSLSFMATRCKWLIFITLTCIRLEYGCGAAQHSDAKHKTCYVEAFERSLVSPTN